MYLETERESVQTARRANVDLEERLRAATTRLEEYERQMPHRIEIAGLSASLETSERMYRILASVRSHEAPGVLPPGVTSWGQLPEAPQAPYEARRVLPPSATSLGKQPEVPQTPYDARGVLPPGATHLGNQPGIPQTHYDTRGVLPPDAAYLGNQPGVHQTPYDARGVMHPSAKSLGKQPIVQQTPHASSSAHSTFRNFFSEMGPPNSQQDTNPNLIAAQGLAQLQQGPSTSQEHPSAGSQHARTSSLDDHTSQPSASKRPPSGTFLINNPHTVDPILGIHLGFDKRGRIILSRQEDIPRLIFQMARHDTLQPIMDAARENSFHQGVKAAGRDYHCALTGFHLLPTYWTKVAERQLACKDCSKNRRTCITWDPESAAWALLPLHPDLRASGLKSDDPLFFVAGKTLDPRGRTEELWSDEAARRATRTVSSGT